LKYCTPCLNFMHLSCISILENWCTCRLNTKVKALNITCTLDYCTLCSKHYHFLLVSLISNFLVFQAKRTLLMKHEAETKTNAYWLGLLAHLQSSSVPRKVNSIYEGYKRINSLENWKRKQTWLSILALVARGTFGWLVLVPLCYGELYVGTPAKFSSWKFRRQTS
jgi:hypothetical protein